MGYEPEVSDDVLRLRAGSSYRVAITDRIVVMAHKGDDLDRWAHRWTTDFGDHVAVYQPDGSWLTDFRADPDTKSVTRMALRKWPVDESVFWVTVDPMKDPT